MDAVVEIEPWLNGSHGGEGFHPTQILTGHDCFKAYLKQLKDESNDICDDCG